MSDEENVLLDSGTLSTGEKWAVVGKPIQSNIEPLLAELWSVNDHDSEAGSSECLECRAAFILCNQRGAISAQQARIGELEGDVAELGEKSLKLHAEKINLGIELRTLAMSKYKAQQDSASLIVKLDATIAKHERLIAGLRTALEDGAQWLGKAIGYPWYKDDQKTFPGTTEKEGVVFTIPEEVFSHAAAYIVERDTLIESFDVQIVTDTRTISEQSATITSLQEQVEMLRKASHNVLKVQLATKPPISPAPLNSGAGQSEAAYKFLRDALEEVSDE